MRTGSVVAGSIGSLGEQHGGYLKLNSKERKNVRWPVGISSVKMVSFPFRSWRAEKAVLVT